MSRSVHLPEDAGATFALGARRRQAVRGGVRPGESLGAFGSGTPAQMGVSALRTPARCDELDRGTSEIQRLVIARAITGLQIA